MSSFLYSAAGYVLAAVLAFAPPSAVLTPAAEPAPAPEIVRVGFPQQEGLTETDENGRRSGYTYEYLMEIAQYTGWEYEFVELQDMDLNTSLSVMLKMLEEGELDLMGSISRSEALEELYAFPGYHYGTSSATLWTLDTNTELTPQNYIYWERLRIAALERAKRQNGLLEHFCKSSSLSPQLVSCKSLEEQLAQLESGNADLAVGRDLSPVPGSKVIAKFSPEPFFFAATKGKTELIRQLDSALLHIEETNPNFSTTLYNKYFAPDDDNSFRLTEDEQSLAEAVGVLRVGLLPDRSPIQSYGPDAGGIMVDILARVSRDTGLQFTYSSADSPEEFDQMAAAGEFDLVAGMDYNYEQAKSYRVIMTQPVLSVPHVRVENTAKPGKNRVCGFPARMPQLREEIEKTGAAAVPYPTSAELMKAVSQGLLEAAYLDSYVAQKLISDQNYRMLSLTAVPGGASQLCFGVSRGQDFRLLSVLSKLLRSIPEHELSSIVFKNTLTVQPTTLYRLLTLYPLLSMLIVALALLVIILALAFHLKRTNVLKNALSAKARTDALTGLYNLEAFQGLVRDSLARGGTDGGVFFFMDVDDFKSVNDRFGHFEGDDVLKGVAAALRDSLRSEDLIGRLGGDEFVAFSPKLTDVGAVTQKCDRIMECCAGITDKAVVTLSIGAVCFHAESSFDTLYRQADANLYYVKQNGRNGYKITETE